MFSACFSQLLMDSRTKVIHKNTSYTFIFMSLLETLSARTMPYTGFECIGIFICEKYGFTHRTCLYRLYCVVLYTQNQRQLLPNITEPSKQSYITHSLTRRLTSGFWGRKVGGIKKIKKIKKRTHGLSLSLQTCYCIVKHTFLL